MDPPRCRLASYTVLSIAATWPLARNFDSRLIGDAHQDQMHSVWILWHTNEWLHGREALFSTDLLYHLEGISILTDGVGVISGFFSLPFWHWGPSAAYNGTMLVGLVLSGYCMFLLAGASGSARHLLVRWRRPADVAPSTSPVWPATSRRSSSGCSPSPSWRSCGPSIPPAGGGGCRAPRHAARPAPLLRLPVHVRRGWRSPASRSSRCGSTGRAGERWWREPVSSRLLSGLMTVPLLLAISRATSAPGLAQDLRVNVTSGF